VNTDRTRLELTTVHHWLATNAFWVLGRAFDEVSQAAQASINFGVYNVDAAQVDARVFTDTVTFSWLCDVYIARHVRGRGLGTTLSEDIVDVIRPLGLNRFRLSTVDAHARR
jgi:GNAT superfamily N-acetyltransferase